VNNGESEDGWCSSSPAHDHITIRSDNNQPTGGAQRSTTEFTERIRSTDRTATPHNNGSRDREDEADKENDEGGTGGNDPRNNEEEKG
jgi:hypothetical protein